MSTARLGDAAHGGPFPGSTPRAAARPEENWCSPLPKAPALPSQLLPPGTPASRRPSRLSRGPPRARGAGCAPPGSQFPSGSTGSSHHLARVQPPNRRRSRATNGNHRRLLALLRTPLRLRDGDPASPSPLANQHRCPSRRGSVTRLRVAGRFKGWRGAAHCRGLSRCRGAAGEGEKGSLAPLRPLLCPAPLPWRRGPAPPRSHGNGAGPCAGGGAVRKGRAGVSSRRVRQTWGCSGGRGETGSEPRESIC